MLDRAAVALQDWLRDWPGWRGSLAGGSLRSGLVTGASRQGVSLQAIMQLTEHRSVSSVIGYFQTGGASANPAANLLED